MENNESQSIEFRQNGVMTVTFYKDKRNKKNLRKLGLNERQIKAVMYVKEKGKITNSEYQKLVDISKATAMRDLTMLADNGIFLQHSETEKGTIYKLKGS